MSIIVDANLVVSLATRDPRAAAVDRHFRMWLNAGEDLHAPSLLNYEVANAFVRLVVADRLDRLDLTTAWDRVEALPIRIHVIRSGPQIADIALQLGRNNAYDAAYIVLAQQLNAELWTLDGPLARNAASIGFPVHLIDIV